METVADVLGRKFPQFNTVSADCMVSDALYQMCCENVDFLIVLDQDKFLGILTDHDIANKVLFATLPLKEIKVKEFMNRTLPVATPGDSLEYCMQLAERYNARYIVIYDQFTFKGVISAYDLMHQALKERKGTLQPDPQRQAYPWN